MTDETRLRADIETRIQTLRYAEAHRFAKAERERCTDDILRDVDALIAASRARVRELETALRPFATFWNQWQRKPLSGMADTFYAIHTGTEYAAELRRSDCERAAALLSEEPIHDR